MFPLYECKRNTLTHAQSFFQHKGNDTYNTIGHVRYINILAWLRGFRVKIANFSSFFCLSIPKRDLDTKKTTPNIEFWPESLGAMLEYWYIERGLLRTLHSLDYLQHCALLTLYNLL